MTFMSSVDPLLPQPLSNTRGPALQVTLFKFFYLLLMAFLLSFPTTHCFGNFVQKKWYNESSMGFGNRVDRLKPLLHTSCVTCFKWLSFIPPQFSVNRFRAILTELL